ncbi:MAG: hypothetical protein ACE37F_37440 [Nannocystaceae bacterium]|nr:hypothetical protein [bacterium]
MRRAAFTVLAVVGCGDAPVVVAGSGSSGGTSSSGGVDPQGSSSSATSGTTLASSTGSVDDSTSAGASTTTGAPAHCRVEVLESVQLSTERFGTLTLAGGDSQLLLLGARGWVLSGSLDAPLADRFVETTEPLLVGRCGPGGSWAYVEVGAGQVAVLPLDDPGTRYETELDAASRILGDIDDDGLDDFIVIDGGAYEAWRADGSGGFEFLAASAETFPNAFTGFAPATAFAPPAILAAQDDSGVAGLQRMGDVLEKTYTVEASLVWSAQGVPPSVGAGRSILVARYGGVLIDPLVGYVGFLDGQEGGWTLRGLELQAVVTIPPRAFDLDADGVLDAVAATSGSSPTLRGACSEGATLLGCLEAPLAGTPEALAVDDEGVVYVATQDEGLWAYRLSGCR